MLKLTRTLTAAAGLIALTACAAAPVAQLPPPSPAAEAARTLYAGEPAAVHGAEYPVTSTAEGVQRGDAAWQRGELDLALYLYVQALQLNPQDASTLRKIGAIHEGRGNRPLARQAFEMALAREPDHAATLERLGLLWLQDGNNDVARMLLERAVMQEPNRWRSHNGLGVLFDRAGNQVKAIEQYDIALGLQSSDAAATLNNRGHSKFLAGDQAGAERDLRRAIELGAGDRAWLNLGRVQARDHDYSEALKSFLKTCDPAHAYNEAGEAAMHNGDDLIAQIYFERALEASAVYYEQAGKNLVLLKEKLSQSGGGPNTPTAVGAGSPVGATLSMTSAR